MVDVVVDIDLVRSLEFVGATSEPLARTKVSAISDLKSCVK